MSNAILDAIIQNTKQFLDEMPKSARKKKGQFFTSKETAIFMASLFDLDGLPEHVTVLDPGAGSGILSAAIVERICSNGHFNSIHLVCYDTDDEIQELLHKNLEIISELSRVPVEYDIRKENYILAQQDDFNETWFASGAPLKYDLVIGNPPYLRVMRDDPCAVAMPKVVHGAPNLYFIFLAMSLFNLKDERELVYIIPRSWTSGAYFQKFREYLLATGRLLHIHLFVSRDKVFKEEEVLQETIILKVKKTQKPYDTITISSSCSNNDFENIIEQEVPYSTVVSGVSSFVFLPTNPEELGVLKTISKYKTTFPDIGLRMRTGIVVDFRQWDDLRKEPGEHVIPLFYSQHIRDGRVHHNPSGKGFDWITDDKPGLIQKNKNYVFCKRFTAKEERRRLQCGIYLAEDFPQYSQIGTQNKINYVDWIDGRDMSKETAYGIYALLNSTLFDVYYRILNGSTQVNSTEVNTIPVPPIDLIDSIGNLLIAASDLSTKTCDRIIEEIAYE